MSKKAKTDKKRDMTKSDEIRDSKKHIKWRRNVYIRDKFTCQKCGTRDDLIVHHIKSINKFPELGFAVSNGLTLCEKCHIQTENYGSKEDRKGKKYRKHDWRVMRDTYITKPQSFSLRKLAREFNVDATLVSRRARKEGWAKGRKKHLDKISTKVYQKSSTILVLDHIKTLKITQDLLSTVLTAIEKKEYDPDDKLSALVNSSDKLIRLYELLSGHPDSRPGEGMTFEEFIRELRKRRTREHKNIQVIEAEATIKELGKPEDD